MGNGDVVMTSLIIAICVIIPALIAIAVCVIIFCSYKKKDRKFNNRRSISYDYDHSCEQVPQNHHIIDYSHTNNQYQQQRRLRESSHVFEQPPVSYDNSVNQTRRQQLPLFSPIHTIPSTARVHQVSPVNTPSKYLTMPPSYDEIFSKPYTLTNR